MKKRYLVGLACGVVMIGVAGIANATLMTIGTATYSTATNLNIRVNGNLIPADNESLSATENVYRLIYDDAYQLTWLDYTQGFGDWNAQTSWANSLNTAGVLEITLSDGYMANWGNIANNWRLPAAGPDSGVGDNRNSDFSHLFYEGLGNVGPYAPGGSLRSPGSWGLLNTGDFHNLEQTSYWVAEGGVRYGLGSGWQVREYNDNQFAGMAVRSGEVTYTAPPVPPTPTPEPGTILLMGTGLAGLVCSKLRRNKKA